MENYIITLLTQNPWLIWIILIVLIVLVIIAVLQGRKVSIPGFEFGAKETTTLSSPQPVSPVTLIKNIYSEPPRRLSEEEYERIYQRVVAHWEAEYSKKKTKTIEPVFVPPEPPEETIELFKIQLALENKIKEVVVSWWGGWAGASLSPSSVFLERASHGLFSKELLGEISNFYVEITPGIYGTPEQGDLNRVQIIALDIMRQLDGIPKGPSGM